MLGGKDDNGFGISFRPSEKSISFLPFGGGWITETTNPRLSRREFPFYIWGSNASESGMKFWGF